MKLFASNVFYKLLFDNANDGILLADLKTKKFYLANKTICKMLGYTLKEILQLAVPDIHPEEDLSFALRQFERQSKGKIGENILTEDMPMKRKDGSIFYASVSASRINLDKRMYLMGIFRDMTERKKTEEDLINTKIAAQNVLDDLQDEKERLTEAEAKDQALLSSIGDGVIATDQEGKIMLINHAAERMLGWYAKQVINKRLPEVCQISDEKNNLIPEANRPLSIALQSGVTTTTTDGQSYFFIRKNGTKFPVALSVAPVKIKGKIIGAIDVFRDITKEKEVAQLKDEFLSIASHELRTPMTAIKGFLDMIIKEQVGKIPTTLMRDYLTLAYQGNERMIKLVNDLLNVSRIEAGRMKFDLTDVQMETIIEQTIVELSKFSHPKELYIRFEKPKKPLPKVVAAADKIYMVLTNLVNNALKFTEKGGVKIWTESDKKQILVYIQDTGAGIAKEDQDKLFKKFSQIDTTISDSIKGTGLGLYISKMIIEKLNGKIWCQSEGEGKGSTFSFSLPIKDSLSSKEAVNAIQDEIHTHPDQI